MFTKVCTACRVEKSIDAFSPDNTRKDGYRSQCKECTAKRIAEWRKKHPDLVKSRNKATRKKYHAERIQRDREYYHKNIEERRRRAREYYWRKRDQVRKNQSEWARQNPEAKNAVNRRRRTRELGGEGSHTAADIERIYKAQKGRCYYCGKKAKLTVDHIVPLSRGGTNDPSNIVGACEHCNSSKGNKLPHEWPNGGKLL